jgi:uncharacterized protein (TIGR02453 family)
VSTMSFRGWPTEALDFYEGLEADNSKTYWMAHKAVYEERALAPMLALLAALEPEFGPGRVFRPYRDVRFSADKSPYKTSIAATLERGGYLQLTANGLGVGRGAYHLEPEELARYRAAVADDRSGAALAGVVSAVEAAGLRVSGHDELRTVPRGYPKDHPRAQLLRYKGITAWKEWEPGPWLGRASARDRVVEALRASAPLADWLRAHVHG